MRPLMLPPSSRALIANAVQMSFVVESGSTKLSTVNATATVGR